MQIDERFDLFKNVTKVVDLCAAPGSWSQVLSKKLKEKENAKIVSVDLQPMAPIGMVSQDNIFTLFDFDNVVKPGSR